LQGLRLHRVQPPRALGPDAREPVVAQHPQLLRYGGLGDVELALNHRADLAGSQLAVGQELKDAPADGVSEDVEGVRGGSCISINLYKSTMIVACLVGASDRWLLRSGRLRALRAGATLASCLGNGGWGRVEGSHWARTSLIPTLFAII
jgi:hypothetical protein